MKKVKKEHKEKIMEMIRKAGDPNNYETSWDEKGKFVSKEKIRVAKGKKSKTAGRNFELKVRKDLESKRRIIDKWTNNVDLEGSSKDDSGEPKLIIAKRKYNPFSKVMTIGTGFPDFISIKHIHGEMYSVIGVEVKMNGILSKIEKEKCAWYLKNKIFSQIWIAKKWAPKGVPPSTKKKDLSEGGKKKGQIEYIDFKEKYGKKYNKT